MRWMMSPTAAGVGMTGAPTHVSSLGYPGACAITCLRKRSWISARAGPRFSRSSTGRRFSVM